MTRAWGLMMTVRLPATPAYVVMARRRGRTPSPHEDLAVRAHVEARCSHNG